MIAKYLFTLCIFFSSVFTSLAQPYFGSLTQYFDTLITSLPGNSGNNFQEPLPWEVGPWKNAILSLLSKDSATANTYADSVGYRVSSFFDLGAGIIYHLLEEKPPFTRYWGTYVFNPVACRSRLIIQSPHPKYDTNTGHQGVYCFVKLNAKAFFISGTHRCNQSAPSMCSGSTSSCGSSAPFRISDNPHNEKSAFHLATELIRDSLPDAVIVQLHGFAKQPTDPYVILSNGTRDTPTQDYILDLSSNLLLEDNSLTFKIAHIDTAWTRLIAFTNVQGRYINQSSDACLASATISQGQFIHVEQEKSKLRDDSTGWHKMYLALANTFNCDTLVGLIEPEKNRNEVIVYPAMARSLVKIKGAGLKNIQLISQFGKVLLNKDANGDFIEFDIEHLAAGLYWIRVEVQSGLELRKIVKL